MRRKFGSAARSSSGLGSTFKLELRKTGTSRSLTTRTRSGMLGWSSGSVQLNRLTHPGPRTRSLPCRLCAPTPRRSSTRAATLRAYHIGCRSDKTGSADLMACEVPANSRVLHGFVGHQVALGIGMGEDRRAQIFDLDAFDMNRAGAPSAFHEREECCGRRRQSFPQPLELRKVQLGPLSLYPIKVSSISMSYPRRRSG